MYRVLWLTGYNQMDLQRNFKVSFSQARTALSRHNYFPVLVDTTEFTISRSLVYNVQCPKYIPRALSRYNNFMVLQLRTNLSTTLAHARPSLIQTKSKSTRPCSILDTPPLHHPTISLSPTSENCPRPFLDLFKDNFQNTQA